MKTLCYGDARISSALVTMTAIMGVPHILAICILGLESNNFAGWND